MKKIIYSALVALAFVGVSCSSDDNSSNDDNDGGVKPNVNIKYLTQVSGYDITEPNDKETAIFGYNVENKLIKVNVLKPFEEERKDVQYDVIYGKDGRLEKVSEGAQQTFITTVLGRKDDAYTIGKVLEYDKRNNPIKLMVYYDDIRWVKNGKYYEEIKEIKQGIVTIQYDDKPFFMFHTLRSAGIIDALDGVNLNFSAPTQAPQLMLAKELLPTNNATLFIFKNEEGVEIVKTDIKYVLDKENYPISASIVNIKKHREFNWDKFAFNDWQEEKAEVQLSFLFKK